MMMMPSNIHSFRLSSFFLLGSSAWILVNGIYAEIPIIVAALDYDYTVISTITLCITLSNIAPLLWSAIADVRGTQVGIGIVLALGLATSFCMSLTDVALRETSLVAVSVCAGIVGSMSLVLFFPHASSSVDQITSLASGTATANLFVAVLAIVQLNGNEEERFSIQVYFGVLAAIFGFSIVGFIGTLRFKKNYIMGEEDIRVAEENFDTCHAQDNQDDEEQPSHATKQRDRMQRHKERNRPKKMQEKHPLLATKQGEQVIPLEPRFWGSFLSTTVEHSHLNAAQLVLNALTFFLPGVVPFSVQHFPDSQSALHYLTVSQLLAQTLGILLSGKWQYSNVWIQILAVVVVWIPTVVFSIVNDEAFHETQVHAALPITFSAILNFLYGYSSTTFFHLVASKSAEKSQSAARVMGTWHQVGAMVGSLVGYFLIQSKIIQ
jgi:hypothetical protein